MDRKTVVYFSIIILLLINCSKKDENGLDIESYFCRDKKNEIDTNKIRATIIGKWQLVASLSPWTQEVKQFENQPKQTYLIIYPDFTYERFTEGDTILKDKFLITIDSTTASSNVEGNFWFCNENILITSNAYLDGPTYRYERSK